MGGRCVCDVVGVYVVGGRSAGVQVWLVRGKRRERERE